MSTVYKAHAHRLAREAKFLRGRNRFYTEKLHGLYSTVQQGSLMTAADDSYEAVSQQSISDLIASIPIIENSALPPDSFIVYDRNYLNQWLRESGMSIEDEVRKMWREA
jgi:hypothetical protein